MATKQLATAIGALTGAVPLVAMLRLLAGAFDPRLERIAFGVVLLALVPWVGYVAVRARRASMSRSTIITLLLLNVFAVGLLWLFTVGPVLALVMAFAASIVIWLHDLPERPGSGPSDYVRIEELQTEESD